jgi:hypothetical protein
MSAGFIQYRKRGGKEYGYFCHSSRPDDKPGTKKNEKYLGAVVDRHNNIFQSKARGQFMYDKEKGYMEVPSVLKPHVALSTLSGIIDFGEPWIVHEMLTNTGYIDVIKSVCPKKSDSILALLSFKLLGHGLANKFALNRFNFSYAKLLYPDANLSSQRISEILHLLGSDKAWTQFYVPHLQYISELNPEHAILIDSTGIPNNIKINLTQISNHNGKISNEIRLIMALDRITGMPIYFRYVAGNIVDVSTLKTTIDEIESFGINIKDVILDAGYFSANNMEKLHEMQIPYLIRLPGRGNIYKELMANHLPDITDISNNVTYLKREFFAKTTRINYLNRYIYAYVIIDIERRGRDTVEFIKKAREKGLSKEETNDKLKEIGAFVLVSSKNLPLKEVIPLYYTRQSIEQYFDLSKNFANTLPARVHSERNFKGHLLISFIASAALVIINDYIKELNISTLELFEYFHTLRALVNNDQLIIYEGNKKVNEIIKKCKLNLPDNITLLHNSNSD